VAYNLEVAQKNILAEVDVCEDRGLKISVGKEIYDVNYKVVSDSLIHMQINNNGRTRQVNAYVSRGPEGKTVVISGRNYLVKDIEENGRKVKKSAAPGIPDQITPPMPAVVVRIFVQVGEHVKKGQRIIVVSAMKMETTLSAPYNGKVARINAAINDKVAPGQILVEIEKEGEVKK